MYTKTHEVMLEKEIKKLKKVVNELQEHVERLNKFMCETIHATIAGVKLPDLSKSHTEALAEQMLRELEGESNNAITNRKVTEDSKRKHK